MNFSFGMTSSPNKGNPNSYARAAPPAAPPEIVNVMVCANGIVAVQPPFQTPNAAAIRAFMKARCLTNENTQMLVYRKETNNRWTTMALESTPSRPVLTAPPGEAVQKIWTTMKACPEVKQIDLTLEDLTPVTVQQVQEMDFPSLDSLASKEAPPVALVDAPLQVDALALANLQDVIIKGQEAMERNFVNLAQKTLVKMEYIIDMLEGTPRQNDPASRVLLHGLAQTSSAGKSVAVSRAALVSPPGSEPGEASNSMDLAETHISSKRQVKQRRIYIE